MIPIMKKRFLMAVLAFACAIMGYARFGVGLRDTRYVNVNYHFKQNWTAKLEHSIYAEKLSCQYLRLYLGWETSFGIVDVQVEPYFGMTYSNSYSSAGMLVGAKVYALKWLGIEGAVIPHHDSGLGYKTCFLGGLDFRCTKDISITGSVTNRPEYREAQTRVHGGVRFSSGNLWVHPEISIPTSSSQGKNIRVLVSMGYEF